MDYNEAVLKVFQVLVTQVPEAQSLFSTDKPIAAVVFLNKPAVAKIIFSYEPGCTVNYRAMKEKIKLLEPHLKVTSCGPKLMSYLDGVCKHRNMWAVAFADYVSDRIVTFMLEQKLFGRGLHITEREALNNGRPEPPALTALKAAEKKLKDIKGSREFPRYVHILEVCIKQYKIHLERKAQAAKVKAELAKKKRQQQTQARKAKKDAAAATLASSTMNQQAARATTSYNPSLPDFAQFMNSFTAPAPPAVIDNGDVNMSGVVTPAAFAAFDRIPMNTNGFSNNLPTDPNGFPLADPPASFDSLPVDTNGFFDSLPMDTNGFPLADPPAFFDSLPMDTNGFPPADPRAVSNNLPFDISGFPIVKTPNFDKPAMTIGGFSTANPPTVVDNRPMATNGIPTAERRCSIDSLFEDDDESPTAAGPAPTTTDTLPMDTNGFPAAERRCSIDSLFSDGNDFPAAATPGPTTIATPPMDTNGFPQATGDSSIDSLFEDMDDVQVAAAPAPATTDSLPINTNGIPAADPSTTMTTEPSAPAASITTPSSIDPAGLESTHPTATSSTTAPAPMTEKDFMQDFHEWEEHALVNGELPLGTSTQGFDPTFDPQHNPNFGPFANMPTNMPTLGDMDYDFGYGAVNYGNGDLGVPELVPGADEAYLRRMFGV